MNEEGSGSGAVHDEGMNDAVQQNPVLPCGLNAQGTAAPYNMPTRYLFSAR